MVDRRKIVKLKSSTIKTYSELRRFRTFKERYDYLRLKGHVGKATFGFDRYLNQRFYRSREWKQIRDQVIIRDEGCDLGIPGYDIFGHLVIHHINPLTPEDVEYGRKVLLDPDYLICTTHRTHMAIHYGDESLLYKPPVERRPGDTIPWR